MLVSKYCESLLFQNAFESGGQHFVRSLLLFHKGASSGCGEDTICGAQLPGEAQTSATPGSSHHDPSRPTRDAWQEACSRAVAPAIYVT